MEFHHITQAAVGVIQRKDGFVLLAERPAGKPWAGYWEFPGGKVERDEKPAQALVRELDEELGITVKSYYPWLTRSFDYPAKYNAQGELEALAKTVLLHFFIVTEWEGKPQGLERQLLSWQSPDFPQVSPILPANNPIFSALNLPHVYAISNVGEMGRRLFFERLDLALNNGLKMMQVREKQLSTQDLSTLSTQIVSKAKPYGAKVFLNGSDAALTLSLALKVGATGIHLSSGALMQLKAKPVEILCGASCHNEAELARAARLGLDYVMLSPVAQTQSHPNAQVLGWDNFAALIKTYALPVYALGGMRIKHLHQAKSLGAHGIAMLREAWG